MLHRVITGITFFLSVLIAGLHLGALKYYWYWTYWWFDIPLHFLGGIVIGLLFLTLHRSSVLMYKKDKINFFIMIMLFVLMIGFAWEVFEVFIDLARVTEPDFISDTTFDIFLDFAGGLTAYMIFITLSKHINIISNE